MSDRLEEIQTKWASGKIEDYSNGAGDIHYLLSELDRVTAERDAAVKVCNAATLYLKHIKRREKMNIIPWINAEDALPPKDEVKKYISDFGEPPMYLVMIAGAAIPTTLYYEKGKWFRVYNGKNEYYIVTDWYYLPDPPAWRMSESQSIIDS